MGVLRLANPLLEDADVLLDVPLKRCERRLESDERLDPVGQQRPHVGVTGQPRQSVHEGPDTALGVRSACGVGLHR